MASLSSQRSIGNREMAEEDQQAWNRSRSGQFRASYTEHDAAIDRAIAETYGGGSGAMRDADGNQQAGQRTAQNKAPKASTSSGYSTSGTKREKSRGQSVTRGVVSRGKSDGKIPTTEQEKWIHRDKLALIEVQEFRELGLEPPQELLRRLAESRAGNRPDDAEAMQRIQTPEPDEFEDAQEVPDEAPQDYRQQQQHYQDETEGFDSTEVEAYQPQAYAAQTSQAEAVPDVDGNGRPSSGHTSPGMLRKSHSRLPVSSSSNTPIAKEPVERESPVARKRGPSSGETESIGYPRVRPRKGSIGSQVMLDDEPGTPNRMNFPASPSKASFSSLSKPKEKGKGKFNTISSVPKTRSTSTGRPGTAGDGRPRTATNPPEGDPPWLAGMYKPDPRLPPDQQMLPTHAKRLAQEQWDRDGKSANVYDRDFNPITNFDDASETMAAEKARSSFAHGENGHDSGRESGFDSRQGVHEAHESPLREENAGLGIQTPTDPDWPLTASRTPSPSKKRINGGGYSTIPRLTDSPKPAVGLFPSPRPGDQPAEAARPVTRHGQGERPMDGSLGLETRVTGGIGDPEKAEKEKKRGGCGCCTIM